MKAPDPVAEVRERERVAYLMERGAVFVFGSNLDGIHGAGAAATAVRKWGARWKKGEGLAGRSYAIPTKENPWHSLPLDRVRFYVDEFLSFARSCPEVSFAVTRIGCGYAGFTDAQIAPLFRDAPPNCELPEGWRE